jgi:hypothetical protein
MHLAMLSSVLKKWGLLRPRSRLSMSIGRIGDGVANVINILLFRNLVPVRPSSPKSIPNCSIQEARAFYTRSVCEPHLSMLDMSM